MELSLYWSHFTILYCTRFIFSELHYLSKNTKNEGSKHEQENTVQITLMSCCSTLRCCNAACYNAAGHDAAGYGAAGHSAAGHDATGCATASH